MEAIDGNCINDATHTKISEKASTSGAEVGPPGWQNDDILRGYGFWLD
jgi:hypothetical protein